MSDIVAELDAIIATDALEGLDNAKRLNAIVQRARDEIVKLRAEHDVITRLVPPGGALFTASYVDAVRAEALEQAAMRCEGSTEGGSIFAAERVAAAIRALKG